MRALLDTNIYVSYLLTPEQSGPIVQIVHAAVLGQFTLLLPQALLEELAAKVEGKPYLAQRIKPQELSELADTLQELAETIPTITDEIPAVTRDPKDDYLLAYALVGQADYLVTGDEDLLVLKRVDTVAILTPREFAKVLRRG